MGLVLSLEERPGNHQPLQEASLETRWGGAYYLMGCKTKFLATCSKSQLPFVLARFHLI